MKSEIANYPKMDPILWAIWGAVFAGLVVIYFAFAGGTSGKGGLGVATAELPYLLLIGAAVVRWLVIPRAKRAGGILILALLGIALSEAATYLQLFAIGEPYPNAQPFVFMLSLLSLAQFTPHYIKRYLTQPIDS